MAIGSVLWVIHSMESTTHRIHPPQAERNLEKRVSNIFTPVEKAHRAQRPSAIPGMGSRNFNCALADLYKIDLLMRAVVDAISC